MHEAIKAWEITAKPAQIQKRHLQQGYSIRDGANGHYRKRGGRQHPGNENVAEACEFLRVNKPERGRDLRQNVRKLSREIA